MTNYPEAILLMAALLAAVAPIFMAFPHFAMIAIPILVVMSRTQ